MSSIIKVNTVQDADGNNIINESGDVITVGAAGDTVTVAGNVVKSNALQASDGGNVVSQSGTTITVGASGDTVTIPSGATVNLSNATVTLNDSMKMTPSFLAYCNTQQAIAHATNTKIGYDTELLDTDSAYNASNSTFTVPSGKAGVYAFFMNVSLHDFSTNEAKRVIVRLYINGGTQIAFFGEHQKSTDGSAGHRTSGFTMLNLAVGDTIEPYIYQNSGSSYNVNAELMSNTFGAYKIIT